MEQEKMGDGHTGEPPHVLFRKVAEALETQVTENRELRQRLKELEK